jgi:UDP-N-acetylmuramate--alanine ligase
VEISSVLKAARIAAGEGRVIAVKQPHRFTRLRDLFDEFCTCFNDADTVLVAPVYRAGEEPLEGFDEVSLVSGLKSGGHRDARVIEGDKGLASLISTIAEPGDYVIFLGAGSVSGWANALPDELAALDHDHA